MSESSIYKSVKDKLITHGVMNTEDGFTTLNDKLLFKMFVELERAKSLPSFDDVQLVATKIDNYLASIGKRQVMAFVYMYLRFSDLTENQIEPDEVFPDGRVRKSGVFVRDVSDEERLIGLWGTVKYKQFGEEYLGVVYRTKIPSS